MHINKSYLKYIENYIQILLSWNFFSKNQFSEIYESSFDSQSKKIIVGRLYIQYFKIPWKLKVKC